MKLRKNHKMLVLRAIVSQMAMHFFVLTTCLVLINGFNALIFERDAMMASYRMLIFPFIIFLSGLPALIYVVIETTSRAGEIILRVVHMVLIIAVVIGAVFSTSGRGNMLVIIVGFALLYLASSLTNAAQERRVANAVNKCLQRLHEEDSLE